MTWQDIILTVGNLLMAASLIPSVVSSDKPALSTSLLSGSILFTFAIVFATLSLWITAFAVSLNVILWFVLALQKYQQQRAAKNGRT
jgi:hypothetical protein